jgi:hypothetical protein
MSPGIRIPRRELAQRVNGGLQVTLYWYPRDDSVGVEIHQLLSGATISFAVQADRALEAFHHPFALLAGHYAADPVLVETG